MEPVNPTTPAVPPDGDRKPRSAGRPRDPGKAGLIIEATIKLLAARGPAEVTADDIATLAKVGKATLYRRWGSVDALLTDTVRTLGVREEDVAWPEPGSVREDLITLLTAATTGVRARAELALLSSLPYREDLRQAYENGPRARLTGVILAARRRAHDRGAIAEQPSTFRVRSTVAMLRQDSAERGLGWHSATEIATVVDSLLVKPGPPYPPLAPSEDEWQRHLASLCPARDDDYSPAAVDRDQDADPPAPRASDEEVALRAAVIAATMRPGDSIRRAADEHDLPWEALHNAVATLAPAVLRERDDRDNEAFEGWGPGR